MTVPGAARGSAVVDYLGAVVAVGLLLLALTAVREHRPGRRPPVDPVARVAALVTPAPVPRAARAPVSGVRPHRRRAPRRPPPPRPSVLVPGWAVGW